MINKPLVRGACGIYKYHKLKKTSFKSWRLIRKTICASTEIELSNWIKEKPVKKDSPIAIFAASQKYGKGQFGRYWESPKGGVWVSAAINTEGTILKNSQLFGLAVALAMVENFERIGIDVKIKWPNDLLVDGKKLAGILPRLLFRGDELRLIRVGIGLNVFNNVPKVGISLRQILASQKININFWSSEVLFAIERSLNLLDDDQSLCFKINQRLWSGKYIDKKNHLQWDIQGIDSMGRLIVIKDGKESILSTSNIIEVS